MEEGSGNPVAGGSPRHQVTGIRSLIASCRRAIITYMFLRVDFRQWLPPWLCSESLPREGKKEKKHLFIDGCKLAAAARRCNTETNPRKLWRSSVHSALLALVNSVPAKFPCSFYFFGGWRGGEWHNLDFLSGVSNAHVLSDELNCLSGLLFCLVFVSPSCVCSQGAHGVRPAVFWRWLLGSRPGSVPLLQIL